MPSLEVNLGLKIKTILCIHTAREMGDSRGSLMTLAGFEVGIREEQTLPVPCISPLQDFWVLQFKDPCRAYTPSPPSLAASSSCRQPQLLGDPKHSAIRDYCLG